MKFVKTDRAWSFSDYKDESGRFLIKNIQTVVKGGVRYALPASDCGWELYDSGEKVGFYKTLKAAKAESERRAEQ